MISFLQILFLFLTLSLNLVQAAIRLDFEGCGSWVPSKYNDTHILYTTMINMGCYIGIGIGSNMKNADIILFETKLTEPTAIDTFSNGYHTPKTDDN